MARRYKIIDRRVSVLNPQRISDKYGHYLPLDIANCRDDITPPQSNERAFAKTSSIFDDTTLLQQTTSSEFSEGCPMRRGRPLGARNRPKGQPKEPKRTARPRGRPLGVKNKDHLLIPLRRLRIAESDHTDSESPTSTPSLLERPYTSTSRARIDLQKADRYFLTTVAVGAVAPPPLPPSVEEAYRKKCIELKRRMTEVEESNDAYRLRKARLQRGIRKMRLERAYLLEILAKRMKKNGGSVDEFQGVYDEDSEGSSEAPPTPNEKPLRSKRSHRRPISSPPPMAHQHPRPLAPSHIQPATSYEAPTNRYRELQFPHVPTTNGHIIQYQPPPGPPHPSALAPAPAPHPVSPTNPATTTSSQQQQQLPPLHHHRAPPPPASAFEIFVTTYILPHREEFPYANEDEALRMGQRAWEDPQLADQRRTCEETYEHRLRAYHEKVREYERAVERERGEEQGEAPVAASTQGREVREGGGSGTGNVGGFTSING